jgi:ribosomal protein L18E
MQERGLIKDSKLPVKVLGGAILSKPITIIADRFSKSATSEIERTGGKAVSLLEKLPK